MTETVVRDPDRERVTTKIDVFLTEVGASLKDEHKIDTAQVFVGDSVNAFYQRGHTVVHIHVDPYWSTDHAMYLFARILDGPRMEVERNSGVAIGEEHRAVIAQLTNAASVPYETEALLSQLNQPV